METLTTTEINNCENLIAGIFETELKIEKW